ncbi:MAG: ABC transporter substrate-binding protein [Chloroflexota bacterium]|nr:ABC transporter substrate-binding protein [Chloroflexota bacterium]MDE2969237.1 ABC transporter substrate-binding protein [Chloroflexota bacterium]
MASPMHIRLAAMAMALAAMLALVAACGGDSDDGGATATTTTSPSAPQQPQAAAAPDAPAGVTSAPGVAPTAEPAMAPRAAPEAMMVKPTVDRVIVGIVPFSQEANVRRIVGQIAAVQFDPMDESLIGMDPLTGQQIPELAEEWALEGGNTWRFKLRQGVQFHKGWGEVTAQDVQFAYEEYIKDDAVGGVRAPLRRGVNRIEAVNDHELLIHLNQFDADLVNLLSRAQPAVSIVSKAHADEIGADPDFDSEPAAGSGPYQFMEREQNVYFRYERNPVHRSITPDFPELEFRYMNEASTRLAALVTKEIHVTNLPDDLYPQALDGGMKVIQGRASLRRAFMTYYCCFVDEDTGAYPMHPDSPLQDARVRRALNKAVNRDEINQALLAGKGIPMYINNFNPSLDGWSQSWVDRFPEAYGFDPAAAQALLSEAGYSSNNPLETNVHVFRSTQLAGADDLAEVLGAYLQDIGVKVNYVQDDPATRRAKSRTQQYTNHLSLGTTSAGQIVGSSVYTSNTSFSRAATVPEADAKFLEIRTETNDNRRSQLWTEYGNLLFDNYTHMPLFWLPAEVVVNPEVVSDFVWPGALSGFWSHMWGLKSA